MESQRGRGLTGVAAGELWSTATARRRGSRGTARRMAVGVRELGRGQNASEEARQSAEATQPTATARGRRRRRRGGNGQPAGVVRAPRACPGPAS